MMNVVLTEECEAEVRLALDRMEIEAPEMASYLNKRLAPLIEQFSTCSRNLSGRVSKSHDQTETSAQKAESNRTQTSNNENLRDEKAQRAESHTPRRNAAYPCAIARVPWSQDPKGIDPI
jgi:hypothetical protein